VGEAVSVAVGSRVGVKVSVAGTGVSDGIGVSVAGIAVKVGAAGMDVTVAGGVAERLQALAAKNRARAAKTAFLGFIAISW
jgi:hypothetical protein